MADFDVKKIDPIIHGKIRLAIMAYLSVVNSASFVNLREKTKASDGNLSTNLTKLEEAKYIEIKKSFEKKRPLTTIIITKKGKKAWADYLDKMLALLSGNEGVDKG